MFRNKTTITRPDRDRLVEVTRSKANALSWALFIDALRREIEDARVVESRDVAHDVVTMNSTVRFMDLETEQHEVYTLVYPHEAGIRDGKLSVLTPLGTALLGARVGDVIDVPAAAGARLLQIESVLDQPESHARFGSPALVPGVMS